MEEKRKTKRYEIAYLVEIVKDRKILPVEIINLSADGISFKTRERFSIKDGYYIRLFMRNRMHPMNIEIVYIAEPLNCEYTVGAKFINEDKEFKQAFDKELGEIDIHQKESGFHKAKNLSFKEASNEYLAGVFAGRSM